jgi:hypothetical protein
VECKVKVCWPRKKVSSHSAKKHASRCENFCMELDLKYVRYKNYFFLFFLSTFTNMGDCGKLYIDYQLDAPIIIYS